MSNELRLSIIICTRNRSRLLREAIQSLLVQNFDQGRYEVVVVDNASIDNTEEVVRNVARESPVVRYVSCPEPGLPKARVSGATHARAPVIGYLDDDARACSDWLQRADEISRRLNPICFGGPFFARYENPKPDWFRDEYGAVTYGPSARWLNSDEFLCGGNIFFDRESLQASGGFDPNFARSTDAFTYGEETVPQVRLRKIFPEKQFYYDPALSILHLVRPERMSVTRGAREAFELGRGYGKLVLAGRQESRRFPFLRRLAWRYVTFFFRSLFGSLFRDRRKFPHWQNYIYEAAAQELRAAGYYLEHYRNACRFRNGGTPLEQRP